MADKVPEQIAGKHNPCSSAQVAGRRATQRSDQLATAIHDSSSSFTTPARRHSALGMLSPIEYEDLHNTTQAA